MNGIKTQIVDKNGKVTHVYRNPDRIYESRVASLPSPGFMSQEEDRFGPAQLTLGEAISSWDKLKSSKTRWSKTEKRLREEMDKLVSIVVSDARDEHSVRDLRSYFSGLHFSKEMLSSAEYNALIYAESLLDYIDPTKRR